MSTKHVSYIRLILGVTVGSAVVAPQLFQPLLDNLWNWLKTSSIYRSSTFETFWTVFCYAAIEPYITYVFVQNPEWRFTSKRQKSTEDTIRRPHGMKRPSRRIREGLTYIAPLLLLDLTMIKKFAGVSIEDMLASGNYDPSLANANCWGNTCHTHFLMPSVHNFSLNSPLQTRRALPDAAPTSRRLILELVCSLIIYDASFFLFHLSLHILPGIRTWHAPHHSHAEIHPQITNQLHVIERLGLVLLANFALNIIKCHVVTRTLFVPVFVWLLVEIHSGMDLPWAYDKVLPSGWGGGARKHARHHAVGEGGFEPYFEWCDRLYGYIRGKSR